MASDFRVDGAKSPEIPQKEGVLGSEIAARNRKSLATFHRTLNRNAALLSLVSESARFPGSAMGIAIANRKNCCDFCALSPCTSDTLIRPGLGTRQKSLWQHLSGRTKKKTAKGKKPDPERTFPQIFCRFSLIFGSLCKSRDLGVADLRRKPQETADLRRKPQKPADFCRNRFLPFAVSLLARS